MPRIVKSLLQIHKCTKSAHNNISHTLFAITPTILWPWEAFSITLMNLGFIFRSFLGAPQHHTWSSSKNFSGRRNKKPFDNSIGGHEKSFRCTVALNFLVHFVPSRSVILNFFKSVHNNSTPSVNLDLFFKPPVAKICILHPLRN